MNAELTGHLIFVLAVCVMLNLDSASAIVDYELDLGLQHLDALHESNDRDLQCIQIGCQGVGKAKKEKKIDRKWLGSSELV